MIIGQAKPHTECSIEISRDWASKASPTLGCSIEISRDIYSASSLNSTILYKKRWVILGLTNFIIPYLHVSRIWQEIADLRIMDLP